MYEYPQGDGTYIVVPDLRVPK
eukprot:COSAG03_NODE_16564_length_398_cov_0.508361_1_plen_21_part_10